jgi:hypothetical protein
MTAYAYLLTIDVGECYYTLAICSTLAEIAALIDAKDGSDETTGGPLFDYDDGDHGEMLEIWAQTLGQLFPDGHGRQQVAVVKRDWTVPADDDADDSRVWVSQWSDIHDPADEDPCDVGPSEEDEARWWATVRALDAAAAAELRAPEDD